MNEQEYRQMLQGHLNLCQVPRGLHSGLIEYLTRRRPTGGFLQAVLSNDLKGAANRADLENRHFLFEIVFFLFNHAPAGAWGSVQLVKEWLSSKEPNPNWEA